MENRGFSDEWVMDEIKHEMKNARKGEDAAIAALDFAIWFFEKLSSSTALILEREKANYLDHRADVLKPSDLKSVLQFTVDELKKAGYPLASLALENRLCQHLGELDERAPRDMKTKIAVEAALRDRVKLETEKKLFNMNEPGKS